MIATIEFPNFKLKYKLNFKFIYSDWGFSQLSAAVAKQWLKKFLLWSSVRSTPKIGFSGKKLKNNWSRKFPSNHTPFQIPPQTPGLVVNVQSTLTISNRPFFEHIAISNKSSDPFIIYNLVPYKSTRYLQHFAVSKSFYDL